MKKDITELPSDVQEQIRGLEALPEDQIDTTDAPEILDWSDARRGVFYRPAKQQTTTMQDEDVREIIEEAIGITAEMNPQDTDGVWLEDLTVQVGPHIKEWDIERCYPWSEWPERNKRFPGTTKQDVGIDAVAVRRSDGEHIAIQCKSRQLDEHGSGAHIAKTETDKIVSTSSGPFWAERWVVTNGNNPLSGNTLQALSMTDKPLKLVDISSDLLKQQTSTTDEDCLH